MQEKNHNNPIQSEMPFAIVDGEQVTELPKDLYIPPIALQVFLDTFEGPLDLLLYLIRKQNLNILDIPIADITEQYVDYINLMKELELELAGEYLLMAAMLAEIKSRMLLPIFEDIEELWIRDDPDFPILQALEETWPIYEEHIRDYVIEECETEYGARWALYSDRDLPAMKARLNASNFLIRD